MMDRITKTTYLKAGLLSRGVQLSLSLLEHYKEPFLVKRRPYGNQDPLHLRHVSIPQEVFI